jgi:hypothetical protein
MNQKRRFNRVLLGYHVQVNPTLDNYVILLRFQKE